MKTKSRTGYLFKRGKNFYCAWRVNDKLITRALRDEKGQPITNKEQAITAREKYISPIAAAEEVEVLEQLTHKLAGRKAEIAKWEDEKNPALSVDQAWSEFLASPNRPDSGESTLRQYGFQWQAFADWMKEKHADKLRVRDVTKEIAEAYASSMNHGRLSPSTYNKHLNLLTLVFRVVKNKAKLTSNVWEDIQRRRIVANSRRELTVDELQKICQTATGELQILLDLAFIPACGWAIAPHCAGRKRIWGAGSFGVSPTRPPAAIPSPSSSRFIRS